MISVLMILSTSLIKYRCEQWQYYIRNQYTINLKSKFNQSTGNIYFVVQSKGTVVCTE